MMTINQITSEIISSAIEVHRTLGPGLLEKEKKMERLIIGVDVSQLSHYVAYFQQESAVLLGKFDNNDDGFAVLEKEISLKQRQFDAQEVLLVLEPTGGYEQRLARFALSQDWFVSLPNPLKLFYQRLIDRGKDGGINRCGAQDSRLELGDFSEGYHL
jgi:hypothetical protein